MKKLLLMFLLAVPLTIFAQSASINSYKIKGQLLDSLTKAPEPYATVRIANAAIPKVPVKMLATDTNGKFSTQLNKGGHYIISLYAVGKKEVTIDLFLKPEKELIDLGKILIRESVNELKEVSVVAQKPLVKVDIDKIEYNIEDDPDSKTSNALEMLRKVPMVTVDGDDKIQLKGSSSFKIYLNGKPSNLISNNPSEVLKSMPASSIKNIEIITNPGAKYDAEGIGGIINIITIGKGLEGYTVTLNSGVSSQGSINSGAYASVKSGKFSLSGNYGYSRQRTPETNYSSYREDFNSNINKYLYQTGRTKDTTPYQYGYMEASYEIDTLNLLSLSVNLFGGKSTTNSNNEIEMKDYLNNPVYSYDKTSKNANDFGDTEANIDYQRSFRKKGELLTFSYKFSHEPNNSNSYFSILDAYNSDTNPYPQTNYQQKNENEAKTDEHTIQIDYVNPLNKIHSIEAGAKYIIRESKSESTSFRMNSGENQWSEVTESYNKYNHTQDIFSGYAGYSLKYKFLGLKTGLRLEQTSLDVKYNSTNQSDFNADFTDLVPSANLSFKLNDTKNIRIAYNMRISRPGIWYLNPYVDNSDPTNISYGNPNLNSEKSHSIDLNYSSFTQKFNINASLAYNFTNNSIQRYSFIKDGVTNSTYGNIGRSNNTNLFVYGNWNATKNTRLYLNGSIQYTDITSEGNSSATEALGLKNSGFTYRFYAGVQQTLPKDFRITANGGYFSPRISLQGEGSSFYYYSLSLNKSLLKKRLNLSVNASNLFQKNMKYENTTESATFYQKSTNYYPSRRVYFSISYRIGDLKSGVKKAARGINNDDVKSGGKSSEGSSQGATE